jgi:hypothetical protein
VKEMGSGLEISLFTCGWFYYHLINAGMMNPQIIPNFIQSKSITHASHLEQRENLGRGVQHLNIQAPS